MIVCGCRTTITLFLDTALPHSAHHNVFWVVSRLPSQMSGMHSCYSESANCPTSRFCCTRLDIFSQDQR
ncbi:hypothetical protein HBI56_203590 [Parastagonospora nodorum]|uniref:Uncharacterized protein n=1 Tax=Phaeosphaeria nodorum (strain SN15 / ATCC MYA-4574 / FGSC 10173) TaxID=321614 RepID=A0A7U2FC62_PHANO|nr:hypothetical protein HBH56_142470 [Parastagonospora nodorum]QRD01569.1 hypothetical protein JI435_416980 [Parastagonospora nodorum SN15]KAH3927522.1 hypothetical protein HBH54_147660 [Parastagonospora nodorum]KAH3961983.1 hypothetical protein HBH51_179290 [Parastagonospora nodorum]KAH3997751.1 hypothetical protein HBI10_138530 [Parastagonospora nodorum]